MVERSQYLISRRSLVAGSIAGLLPFSGRAANPAGVLTPERFGARGDGVTNDTRAFQALAAAVTAAGQGTIELRSRATYIVGLASPQNAAETARNHYTFFPAEILKFENCVGPVVLHGNDATLKAPDGYRYGSFAAAGNPVVRPSPYYGPTIAACYMAMVHFVRCRSTVVVRDLNLDGNVNSAWIGGPWGDAGIQLPGSGVVVTDCTGRWRLINLRAFHHPLDGIMVDDLSDDVPSHSGSGTEGCDFFENGRQGMSIVGGAGYVFQNTRFRRTRRHTKVRSPPGAGVDLEAEGHKTVSNVLFENCEFSDNAGAALLHGGGKVEGITLRGCKLIGTTFYAYYGAGARRVRFVRTVIAGTVVNLVGGNEGEVFEDCLLTNDPARAPTGSTIFSPIGFIIPDAVRGVIVRGGEIRHAIPVAAVNANFDQMTLDGVTIRATAGRVALYGHFRGHCRFVEAGGTISATPGGLVPGTHNAGDSEDSWTFERGGSTVTYPAAHKPVS